MSFLDSLNEGELLALPYLFEFWAFDHQLPPEGDWKTWVILGGRGAGKTRAGAEWVRANIWPRAHCRACDLGHRVDRVQTPLQWGKGGALQTKTTEYSYYASLTIVRG